LDKQASVILKQIVSKKMYLTKNKLEKEHQLSNYMLNLVESYQSIAFNTLI